MARGKKTGGRVAGTPNKVTGTLKEAIAHVVDSTREDCLGWLRSVADGQKESEPILDAEGQPVLGKDGQPLLDWNWLRRPDPGMALKLWSDLSEFLQPKLARTEITGEGGGAVKVEGSLEFVTPVRRAVP